MLSEILTIFEAEGENQSSEDVSQRIGVEPTATEGMLEMLVKMGKLVEIITDETCNKCHACNMCFVISRGRRTFALASRTPVQSV